MKTIKRLYIGCVLLAVVTLIVAVIGHQNISFVQCCFISAHVIILSRYLFSKADRCGDEHTVKGCCIIITGAFIVVLTYFFLVTLYTLNGLLLGNERLYSTTKIVCGVVATIASATTVFRMYKNGFSFLCSQLRRF